jgi:hypothetical protein
MHQNLNLLSDHGILEPDVGCCYFIHVLILTTRFKLD